MVPLKFEKDRDFHSTVDWTFDCQSLLSLIFSNTFQYVGHSVQPSIYFEVSLCLHDMSYQIMPSLFSVYNGIPNHPWLQSMFFSSLLTPIYYAFNVIQLFMIVNAFISSSPTVISCNLTTDCDSVSVYIAVPLPADKNPNLRWYINMFIVNGSSLPYII